MPDTDPIFGGPLPCCNVQVPYIHGQELTR